MADYHPLVARAVAGLDKSTGENRRALYERARAALVAQLRSVEPALDESDITRERLALEDAIRKVEAEAVKRQRADVTEAPAPTLSDQGLRGFRETVADAEGLGGAAAEANRSARQVYEAMPGASSAATGRCSLLLSIISSHPPRLSRCKRMNRRAPTRMRRRGCGRGLRTKRMSTKPMRGRRAPMAASSNSSCCS